MDAQPDPADVPKELINHLRSEEVWKQLCDEWDKKYPQNRVQGETESDDE